jgi:hypothetical protein
MLVGEEKEDLISIRPTFSITRNNLRGDRNMFSCTTGEMTRSHELKGVHSRFGRTLSRLEILCSDKATT